MSRPSTKGLNAGALIDDLQEQNLRFQLLEKDRRPHFKTSVMFAQQYKQEQKELLDEKKTLREEIKSRGIETTKSAFVTNISDTQIFKDLTLLRKKLDSMVKENGQKKENLKQLKDKLTEVSHERNALNSDDNPQMHQIRLLENRLDKAMIKYNEAMSIKKTYELIVKRLKDERVGYDNQLAAIEKNLRGKEHDYEELLLLSRDAIHAKETAEAELVQFKNKSEIERRIRDVEKDKQLKLIQYRAKLNRQLEENDKDRIERENEEKRRQIEQQKLASQNKEQQKHARLEDEKNELLSYEESMKRIKDVTGVSDVNEIIQKFTTQEGTNKSLIETKNELERKLARFNEEKFKLKEKLEKIKYEGSENNTKKQIDEVEKNVFTAQQKVSRSKEKYDKLVKMFVELKSCIEILYDRTKCISIDLPPVTTFEDDTLIDAASQIEGKLVRFYEELIKDKEFATYLEERKTEEIVKDTDTGPLKALMPGISRTKYLLRREELRTRQNEVVNDEDDKAIQNERNKMIKEADQRRERIEKAKTRKTKTAGGKRFNYK